MTLALEAVALVVASVTSASSIDDMAMATFELAACDVRGNCARYTIPLDISVSDCRDEMGFLVQMWTDLHPERPIVLGFGCRPTWEPA